MAATTDKDILRHILVGSGGFFLGYSVLDAGLLQSMAFGTIVGLGDFIFVHGFTALFTGTNGGLGLEDVFGGILGSPLIKGVEQVFTEPPKQHTPSPSPFDSFAKVFGI